MSLANGMPVPTVRAAPDSFSAASRSAVRVPESSGLACARAFHQRTHEREAGVTGDRWLEGGPFLSGNLGCLVTFPGRLMTLPP